MSRWLTAKGAPGRLTVSVVRSARASTVPTGVATVFSQPTWRLRVWMVPNVVKALALARVS